MDEAQTRPLTNTERKLARWMLESGTDEAYSYLVQLDQSEATHWKCPCGCASFHFRVKGHPMAPPGVHILAEFLVGSGENLSGIFIYASQGILSGIEVYGLAGAAPQTLPSPEVLRPYQAGT